MPDAKSSSNGGPGRTGGSARKTPSATAVREAKEIEPQESDSGAAGLAAFAEDLANRLLKPLDLVLISRDRIQATLDDAAERGRVTRKDANELVAELVRRGRQQTEDLIARRGPGTGAVPIDDYDELTVGQVTERLADLSPPQLRRVRDYERRHANRKSVLAAVEKLLDRR